MNVFNNVHNRMSIKKIIKNSIKNIYWKYRGLKIEQTFYPRKSSSYLFVCKGNICRSPFAEYRARKYLHDYSISNVLCNSCGMEVTELQSPPKEAIEAARYYGVNIENHKSKQIDRRNIELHEMIIVMDVSQYDQLKHQYPIFREKIFLMSLFEKNAYSKYSPYILYNIEDPYSKTVEIFNACYQRIERCMQGMFEDYK